MSNSIDYQIVFVFEKRSRMVFPDGSSILAESVNNIIMLEDFIDEDRDVNKQSVAIIDADLIEREHHMSEYHL